MGALFFTMVKYTFLILKRGSLSTRIHFTPIFQMRPSYRTTSRRYKRKVTVAGKAKLQRASASLRQPRSAPSAAYVSAYMSRGVERKTFDPITLGTNVLNAASDSIVAVSGTNYISPNASAVVLNQVPQGTSQTTRIGRKLLMQAIHLRGTITATFNNAFTNTVRLALVYIPRLDRTTTTMPPQNVIWTAQDPRALRLINNVDRFKIIRQWTYQITGDGNAVTTGQEAVHFDEMVKINLPTVWTQANTSGTFDDMEEGALCLYSHGIQANAVGTAVVSYAARLYFQDH